MKMLPGIDDLQIFPEAFSCVEIELNTQKMQIFPEAFSCVLILLNVLPGMELPNTGLQRCVRMNLFQLKEGEDGEVWKCQSPIYHV